MTSPDALFERRLVVCVGTGGVGKTTLAAAMAVEAARRGRRALVVTIDPARRLASALGLDDLGGEPEPLSTATLAQLGVPPEGSLSAMMLDMKGTFDGLVQRFARDAESRERIFSNPIYQHVSDALAGSAEYAAMEKLYELAERDDFDWIVLDTPPSQHALDFLEAPARLLEFLDSSLVHVLVHPALAAGRFGFRLFQRGARRVLQLMERVSGVGFLEDLSEFLLAFEGMAEGFRARAETVRRLLLGPEAAFVLVAGPSPAAARGAGHFLDHLQRSQVPLRGVVQNRVHVWPGGGAPPDLAARDLEPALSVLAEHLGEAGARAAVEAAKGYASWVEQDRRQGRPLATRCREGGLFWRRVPELSADVHDAEALMQVGHLLFEGSEEASRGDTISH
ncbi:MAG: AAA family ATPase [Proteobacteria bacterium]|nr:AAA family ATPase [Pseudomonadota bacterium]